MWGFGNDKGKGSAAVRNAGHDLQFQEAEGRISALKDALEAKQQRADTLQVSANFIHAQQDTLDRTIEDLLASL